ncbi:MAG: hypothetical protein L0Y54_03465 [Sporichthyaceae bacterium]|nr:hypothetical protein [Sporichthyaceae bacterium]
MLRHIASSAIAATAIATMLSGCAESAVPPAPAASQPSGSPADNTESVCAEAAGLLLAAAMFVDPELADNPSAEVVKRFTDDMADLSRDLHDQAIRATNGALANALDSVAVQFSALAESPDPVAKFRSGMDRTAAGELEQICDG